MGGGAILDYARWGGDPPMEKTMTWEQPETSWTRLVAWWRWERWSKMPPLTYYWSQIKQTWHKRHKPARPWHIDAIIHSIRLPHDARILCLGARNNSEPDEWFRRGYERVTAVDLVPSRGVKFADINQTLPFPDGSFDLLYASHIFEHSWDLARALSEACRIIRPSGLLFAAFPVAFEPNDHDRWDVGSPEGFLARLRAAQTRPIRCLWTGGTPPGDVSILVALL